ncbi:MAG: zinc-ribbon domain-containing protein [Rhodobacteraceae bacterium]|nr:zinc-ribbon domain-containing protein [Paracoccaceae bacterium]
MQLTCPECGAIYEIDDEAIPPGGRRVECSACWHVWRAEPAASEQEAGPTLPPPLAVDPGPAPEPPRPRRGRSLRSAKAACGCCGPRRRANRRCARQFRGRAGTAPPPARRASGAGGRAKASTGGRCDRGRPARRRSGTTRCGPCRSTARQAARRRGVRCRRSPAAPRGGSAGSRIGCASAPQPDHPLGVRRFPVALRDRLFRLFLERCRCPGGAGPGGPADRLCRCHRCGARQFRLCSARRRPSAAHAAIADRPCATAGRKLGPDADWVRGARAGPYIGLLAKGEDRDGCRMYRSRSYRGCGPCGGGRVVCPGAGACTRSVPGRLGEHPMGPLVLAAADGRPALSLFKRDCRPASRDSTIAFRIAGAAFLGFLDALDDLQLQSVQGRVLTRSDLVDHQVSWSLYFLDPDGNRLELTSYDHGDIAQAIGA